MTDIPGYETFTKIEPLNKGWSSDKKYYIETVDGRRLLLRLADAQEHDRKKHEFEMMEKVAMLGILMSQPIGIGVCCGGTQVYQLLSWCDGEDAETIVPRLTEAEQYAHGVKAGVILKKIHTVDAQPASLDWGKSYSKKLDSYIEHYKNCGMTFSCDKLFFDYIEQNRYLIEGRFMPMCFTHGDFHVGNLIVSPEPENELQVIDFQRCGMSTPYHTFTSIMFSANVSPQFAAGQVDGYFGGDPPDDFWRYLALFLAAVNVHALPWSIKFGQDEIDFAYKMIDKILLWFDNFRNPVPTWYIKA
jgi:serine/threonine-protein kinase